MEEFIKAKSKDFNGKVKIIANKKYITRDFVPIKRSLKKESLNNFLRLFSLLNGLDVGQDYMPTKFNFVSIVIGTKKLFDNFRTISLHNGNLQNCIPCYYLNRDGKESDTLGIEPLIYFTPSYSIAYQHIIKEGRKVSNIILFNDGFNELEQIINDQLKYKFRILGICSPLILNRFKTIKYWEWHKEEVNFIESL